MHHTRRHTHTHTHTASAKKKLTSKVECRIRKRASSGEMIYSIGMAEVNRTKECKPKNASGINALRRSTSVKKSALRRSTSVKKSPRINAKNIVRLKSKKNMRRSSKKIQRGVKKTKGIKKSTGGIT